MNHLIASFGKSVQETVEQQISSGGILAAHQCQEHFGMIVLAHLPCSKYIVRILKVACTVSGSFNLFCHFLNILYCPVFHNFVSAIPFTSRGLISVCVLYLTSFYAQGRVFRVMLAYRFPHCAFKFDLEYSCHTFFI